LDPATYERLRQVASRQRAKNGKPANILTHDLLHEAWMKLENSGWGPYESREHFLAVAARAMRQILVDKARARLARKRGGDLVKVTLTGLAEKPDEGLDVLDLHEAMGVLGKVDPQASEVAQLRAFGGMTAAEVAVALGVSESTVMRKWRFAQAFLLQQLKSESPEPASP
jgi:RNA polymerase sigma factor (TIGR02999 family)